MMRKHEIQIIIFFKHGLTNAKAENLNGKIQRFVSNNYGIKDKDFFLYRTAKYFSWHLKIRFSRINKNFLFRNSFCNFATF
jgi:hypothetical protein